MKPQAILSVVAGLLCCAMPLAAQPISYQGRLVGGGTPATGPYDFEFRLFDVAVGGTQQGGTVAVNDLVVQDGLFSTELDFGAGLFAQPDLYLEIAVRPGADVGTLTTLGGRVRLRPVHRAWHADSAAEADLLDGMDSSEFADSGHGHNLQDMGGAVTDAQVPGGITVDNAANAGLLDGMDSSEFADSAHGHNLQDLGGAVTDAQVPDGITVNYAANADLLDGMDSSAFSALAHGHSSLSGPGGTPVSVVNVDGAGATTVTGSITQTSSGITIRETGGTAQIEGGSPNMGLTVRTASSTSDGQNARDIRLAAGDGPLDGSGAGGNVHVVAGSGGGSSSGAGGDGGTVHIGAGSANGSGDHDGGDIVLTPGDGINAGDAGAVTVYNKLQVFPGGGLLPVPAPITFEVSQGSMRLGGLLYDRMGSPGASGQVLSNDGIGLDWIDSAGDGHSLDSPDGAIADALAINNGGSTLLKGSLAFAGTSAGIDHDGIGTLVLNPVSANTVVHARSQLAVGPSLPALGSETLRVEGSSRLKGDVLLASDENIANSLDNNVVFTSDDFAGSIRMLWTYDNGLAADDTRIVMGSPSSGISYLTATPNAAAGNGETLRIVGGGGPLGAVGDGGNLELYAGNGGTAGFGAALGGEGGDVFVRSGDGQGVGNNNGGDIYLACGDPSGSADQGTVRITGNVSINTGAKPAAGKAIDHVSGAQLSTAGMWVNASDRNSKTDFAPVDSEEILERVLDLAITKWRYKVEGDDVQHIGPTAQDFRAAFGLGADDKSIGTVDVDGVALAAIQGIHRQTQDDLDALRAENAELKQRLAALEATLARLVNPGE